jgi:hypothetical protein
MVKGFSWGDLCKKEKSYEEEHGVQYVQGIICSLLRQGIV